jgi:hypothetical protein
VTRAAASPLAPDGTLLTVDAAHEPSATVAKNSLHAVFDKENVTVWAILLPARRFTINHLGMNHSPARCDLPELENPVSLKKNGRFRARYLATLLPIGLRRD